MANDLIATDQDNNLDVTQVDLSSAKKFFTEAIKLTQAYSTVQQTNKEFLIEVPVEHGNCVKLVLCDEYKGIKLQKFFAKKDTVMTVKDTDICRGFIIHEGSLEISCADLTLRMPRDKHFFYNNGKEEIRLTFFEDTWFYMVSTTV